MAERPPSSAGGGENSSQVHNPQQGWPDHQGTTGAGTPQYANMSIMPICQQNMQVSPPESLYDSASSEESGERAENLENAVSSIAPVTKPVNNPFGVPPIVAPVFDPLNALSPVVDEHDSKQELPPEPDVEPDTKQETVRQKANNQVQSPYMGALPQQDLRASRQGAPLTSQQQQQQVQQQPQYQQPQQPQQQARPQMVDNNHDVVGHRQPSKSRNSWSSSSAQPQYSIPSSAPTATAAPTEPLDATRSNLSKRSLRDLLAEINPQVTLDPDVEDVMLEIADDFIESVASFSAKLAKHRKSDVLEAKDVLLHLEKEWDIKVPGFGGDEYRSSKRPSVSETHKQRPAVVRKSAAAGQAAAVNTESSSLCASAPAPVNASTPVKPAGAAAGSPPPSPGTPRIPRNSARGWHD